MDGDGAATGAVAPESELLPPLPTEPVLPLEPEVGVGRSLVMLGGNWRRGSGMRSRSEAGETSWEGAPVPPEPGLGPEGAGLAGPELVTTPPDWAPPRRRSRASRMASSKSTSRRTPAGRSPVSAAGCPLPPEPTEPPAPLPAFTPEPPVGVPVEPAPGVPTAPEPLPPAGFPPLLPRASGSLRRPGPGSSGGRMVEGP